MKSVAIGIAVFFASLMTFKLLIGPLACWDGWVSPSIGRSGACSSHGGINHLSQAVIALGSLALAVIAGVRLSSSKQSKPLAATAIAHDNVPPHINHIEDVTPVFQVDRLNRSVAFSLKWTAWLPLFVWATARSLTVGSWRIVRRMYMRW